ncbi:MAG: extracellular solute-binding protein [Actinomycetia bacterium]|nr:extracellular solute-binding protein [Actinomycetes bacterium]
MRTPARLRALGAGIAAGLLLAACTGGGSGALPQPSSSGDGEIIVASGLDVTGSDGVRQQLIDAWNRTADGRRHPARLLELPGGADDQRSQLLGALQSGSARYDVVNLDVTWVPEFAQAGLITALDHQVDLGSDFIPSVAGTARWKGHTYALPFNSDVGLLYYRSDYLRKAGIDEANYPSSTTTWRQLQSIVRELDAAASGGGLGPYQKGWTTQLAAYEGLTVNTVEAFATAGVQLTDADGHLTANATRLRDGLEALRDRAGSEYTLHGALSSDESQSLDDFAAGRTAFLRHWPYAYRLLPHTLPDGSWSVAPLPGKAVLGGQDLAVAADSPRAAYALKLAQFLTDRGSERCLLDAGFAATRVSAYKDATLSCPPAGSSPSPSPNASGGPGGSGGEVDRMPLDAQDRPRYASTTLLSALTSAVQRPRTPYYGAFTQALQSVVHGWLANPDPPDTDQVAAQLDTALRRALSGK